jgi:hypothetical protein
MDDGPLEDDTDFGELPRPPRVMRTVTVAVMIVTALLAGWLAASLLPEALYAFRAPPSRDVGVLPLADLGKHEGGFVRGYAKLEGVPTASYQRPLESGHYRVALAAAPPKKIDGAGAGQSQRVWVVYRVPAAEDGPRFVPPQLVAGRLTRMADLGVRFQGVSGVLSELGGVESGDWVLIDGETPKAVGWVLGLEVLLVLFMAFNLLSVVKVLRPVKPMDAD